MKTVKELAADRLDTPDSLKRRATSLRRLSGGLLAETERSSDTGLNDKELRTLKEAADILSVLATRFDGAGKEKKKLLDAREVMKVKVREAMKGKFDELTSIPDQVALVAATSEYQIKNLSTLADLRDAMKENMDYLIYRFAEQAMSRDPKVVVAEGWDRFQTMRASLQGKHAATIGRLATSAQST
ncbi:hypothetical protein [Massilia aerilata]|uniref:Uncharacterized protein n=1 Tax=Massilia aerilata TaxID=453817 RepID=A0ABW0RZW0_9BURK